jgi:hypothetical protein
VRELAGLVNGAITQARALAHGLNPVELHGGDLAEALEALTLKVASSTSPAGAGASGMSHWSTARRRPTSIGSHRRRSATP